MSSTIENPLKLIWDADEREYRVNKSGNQAGEYVDKRVAELITAERDQLKLKLSALEKAHSEGNLARLTQARIDSENERDRLKIQVAELLQALREIADWELPKTDRQWSTGGEMSYAELHGPGGVRDYIREKAKRAITIAEHLPPDWTPES